MSEIAKEDEHSAKRGLRDLMSLLSLPSLWIGRDAESVFQLMTEAIERLVRVDVSYVDVNLLPNQPALTKLRVQGLVAAEADLLPWRDTLDQLQHLPIGAGATVVQTPLGPLRVVRLSMGYSASGGSVWFGSRDPAFPTTTESALLRAASTLAATGLQSVRIDHERQRASRAKDEFLAMLGHELRNPLAPIFTSLEILRRKQAAPLTGPHAIIERQARHLSRLVDDLLDVSRITSGKVELSTLPVSLQRVLEDALEAVEPLMAQRQHQVTLELPAASVTVLGDPTRLKQVFVNLLTNAGKYTQMQGRLRLTTRIEGSHVTVDIEDNGPGISAELMTRLFHIFEQGSSTIDRSHGGLGIGLALVKNFVQLHGGTVVASSPGLGLGATFTVTLPLMQAGDKLVPKVDPAPPHEVTDLRGLRVMLVDDNTDALGTLAEMLRAHGFQVATASEPNQALSLANIFRPAVAILDVGLPGMDGYQLGTELRRLMGSDSPLRLITLSGYGRSVDHEKSAAAGFEHHWVKPVELGQLVRALTEPVPAPSKGSLPG